MLAFARTLTHKQGGRDCLAERVRRDLVAHERLDELGGVLALALYGRKPGRGLDDGVIRRRVAMRSFGAETGNGTDDQPRIDRAQVFAAEAQTVHDTRAVVRDEHVGLGGELLDRFPAGVALEIDAQRSLSPVAVREQCRNAAFG